MGFNPFKMISSFLNPDDAYEKSQDALRNQWGETKEFLAPFREKGLEQYPQISEAIKRLMSGDLQNDWISKYDTSSYAQRVMDMEKQKALEAASSMGLMGSSGALNNIQQGSADIQSKDRQQFLNNLMQEYMSGLGLSSNLYNTGAGVSSNLAGLGSQYGQNYAGLEYGKQAAPGQLFGQLLGAAIGAGTGMGGGGMGGFGGMSSMSGGGYGGFGSNRWNMG